MNQVTSNTDYEGAEFKLQLPTLDRILNQILSLKNPKLIKVDVSRAFRNVPIDPCDAIKCGNMHDDQYYEL